MKKLLTVLVLSASLTACKTTNERAAEFYEQAQQYIEQGDTDRALVELRNALSRDETLRGARLLFAQLLNEKNRKNDAFGQYIKITEQFPDDITANQALSEMAFEGGSWDNAEKFTLKVLEVDPENTSALATLNALEYRAARVDEDIPAMVAIDGKQRTLLNANPKLLQARRVIIIESMRKGDPQDALDFINAGLEITPGKRDLIFTKIAAQSQLGMTQDVEVSLIEAASYFPNDTAINRMLIGYYVQNDRSEDAANYLRSLIDPESDESSARFTYLRFVADSQSDAAMRDVLKEMLEQDPVPNDIASNKIAFEATLASSEFESGNIEKAIEDMEALIFGAEPSEELDRLKVQLARMHQRNENEVGARSLVEQVLAHDPGQSEALKMLSIWQMADDKVQDAVRSLRDALASNPNDTQALTLLASAYQRDGRTELMADMLSRAVEVSDQGAPESLRYAKILIERADFRSAESVLISALRKQPNNIQILTDLARIYIATEDWGRARQTIDTLKLKSELAGTTSLANELQARLLSAQGKSDELTDFLETLSINAGNAVGPELSVIRNAVRTGNLEQGLERTRALAEREPDNANVLVLLAQILLAAGETDKGIQTLEDLTQNQPNFEAGWMSLYRVSDTPAAILHSAREALPNSRAFALLQATIYEAEDNWDGSIKIYEALYEEDSNDLIIANNYANALSLGRGDDASLDLAWSVARRLASTREPAFLDTYGWIAFQRGELEAASQALEFAAQSLPDEPTIQFHLGSLYAAQSKFAEARTAFERSYELVQAGRQAPLNLPELIAKAQAALPE